MDKSQNEIMEYNAQDFAKKYEEICNEYGYRIYASPVWIARDDGTFSMQVQLTVGQLPKER